MSTATHASNRGQQIIYWHRELPPLDAEQMGEHVVEAASMRVKSDLTHRTALWDQCHDDLMAHVRSRLEQEVARLSGDYAHVLQESIDIRRDDASGESWLQGRFTYLLLRRQPAR